MAVLAPQAQEGLVDFQEAPGKNRYVVEAVDLAGNATASDEITADVSGFVCNARAHGVSGLGAPGGPLRGRARSRAPLSPVRSR